MEKLFDGQLIDDITTDNKIETTNQIGATALAIHAFGVFDGTTTVTVFLSLNGDSDGVALPQLIFTAAGLVNLALPAGVTIWATVTNADTLTDVSLFIAGQGNDA